MSVDPNQSDLGKQPAEGINSDIPPDLRPEIIDFDASQPEFEIKFQEDDFDHEFDDDFEEEVKGEYDLEDDQYGEEFNQEFGHLTADPEDDE